MSSPARGTWIEIVEIPASDSANAVVPRKGDVDRNDVIDIIAAAVRVVPRKGDVDRNIITMYTIDIEKGRPPQGGRG